MSDVWFNHRRLHGKITDDASYTTPAQPKLPTIVRLRSAPEVGIQ
jgi:hypothetical protein